MSGGAEDKNDSNVTKVNLFLKSSAAFHAIEGYKYVIKFGDKAKTSVMSILKSSDPGPASQNWFLRFDKAHKGANYPHLNMRHKYTGIQDPHVRLPPGALTVAKSTGYLFKFMNLLRKFSIVYDIYRLGVAMKMDYCNMTIGNTVYCITDIILAWVGGLFGGTVGGFVGTSIFAGVGTLAGVLVGATIGVHYGSELATYLTGTYRSEIEDFNTEHLSVYRAKLDDYIKQN